MPSAQPTIASDAATAGSRSKAPVFVLGSVRSGTTLLYHMLLSSGNFVVYRTESNVFNLLEPRFGDLSAKRNRRRNWNIVRVIRPPGRILRNLLQRKLDGGNCSDIANQPNEFHWIRIVDVTLNVKPSLGTSG